MGSQWPTKLGQPEERSPPRTPIEPRLICKAEPHQKSHEGIAKMDDRGADGAQRSPSEPQLWEAELAED